MEYATNPNHRCDLCNGREVLTIEDEEVVETNLDRVGEKYYCKNKEECRQNVEADNTDVTLSFNEKNKVVNVKVVNPMGEVVEVGDINGKYLN